MYANLTVSMEMIPADLLLELPSVCRGVPRRLGQPGAQAIQTLWDVGQVA